MQDDVRNYWGHKVASRVPQPGRLRPELRARDAGVVLPTGDEDRPDAQHRRGRVCGLLAALLHLLLATAFPAEEQRRGHGVLNLARLDQFGDKSVHLRFLQPGL